MMENPNPMKTSEVTRDLVGTVFLAHSAELLGKIFEVLEKDGSDFFEYAENVRSAFTERFVTEDGRLKNDYQGCYVLALAFDMVSDDVRKLLAKRLAEMIVENGCRLDTGFLSVPYLLDVLCDNGYEELATRLFMQKKCPSWLYEVEKVRRPSGSHGHASLRTVMSGRFPSTIMRWGAFLTGSSAECAGSDC